MVERLPTLTDVARHAGVSYATADRVVNARGGVAAKSEHRVRQAIEALGYVRNVAAANLSRGRTYRFVFVLPDGSNSFFRRVRDILEQARARLASSSVSVIVETVPSFDAPALAACLDQMSGDNPDGVALVGSDDPCVLGALDGLRAKGIAVVTLISDVSAARRDAYVGIDNGIAGRTAGRMLALAHSGRTGRVLPIVGSFAARDHAERLEGLCHVLRPADPPIAVGAVIEGRDDHARVEQAVRDALTADPEITAIYSAGAGNAGLVRVLRALPGNRRRPVVVLHELGPETRTALQDGLIDIVIDQRPLDEINRALGLLRQLADGQPAPPGAPIVPAIFVTENLPPESGPALEGDPT